MVASLRPDNKLIAVSSFVAGAFPRIPGVSLNRVQRGSCLLAPVGQIMRVAMTPQAIREFLVQP